MHVYSHCAEECVKTWAMFPGTVSNLEKLHAMDHDEGKFIALHQELEHGRYVITEPGDGLYLPPGCLYAVYTLTGGLSGVINWMSATSLTASTANLDNELNSFGVERLRDFKPFLWSLIFALRKDDSHTDAITSALSHICSWDGDGLLDDIWSGKDSDPELYSSLLRFSNHRIRLQDCDRCQESVWQHIQRLLKVFEMQPR